MTVRQFELILVVVVLFLSIHFIGYRFFYDEYCSEKSSTDVVSITTMGQCKDSFVCSINNLEYEAGQVSKYTCDKKTISRFELDFYINYIKNIF